MMSFVLRSARCLAGYAAAVFVASQIALLLITVPGLAGEFPRNPGQFVNLMAVAFVFTGLFAAAPSAVFITILEVSCTTKRAAHAASGTVTAIMACLLMFQGDLGRDPGWLFVVMCMAGGACGGLAYQWVAGRGAGLPVFARLAP